MENSLEAVKNFCKEKKYDKALELTYKIKKDISESINPEILVLEGICIQLSDNIKYEIETAKNLFLKALKIDDKNENALIELAYYYMNVDDNADEALPLLYSALKINLERKTEIISALEELKSEKELHIVEFVKDSPIYKLSSNKIVSEELDKAFADLTKKR